MSSTGEKSSSDQTAAASDSAVHQDELTVQQVEAIQREISAAQPMIAALSPVTALLVDYENAELKGFVSGINYLSSKFSALRKVRGDGNCFYRAFLFGYLETLLNDYLSADSEKKSAAEQEQKRVLSIVESSMVALVAVGYSEFTIETFYDEFLELIQNIFAFTADALLELFQEGGKADCYTWFMRLLTAGALKADGDRFLPFIDGLYFDIGSFCASEVEPMSKECEQLQIIALTEYLGITVEIAYLDGREFDPAQGLASVVFPDPSAQLDHLGRSRVHLLYRPGHYDILYK